MKIKNVVVCDQVRVEKNGKHILIGVYPRDIKFGRFPAKIGLSIWLQMVAEGGKNLPVQVRVIDSNQKALYHADGEIQTELHESGLATVTIPMVFFEVQEPITILFQIREPKKRWQTLKQMPVSLRESN